MYRIFKFSLKTAPMLAVALTISSAPVISGNLPADKERVISKMSCGELKELLRKTEDRAGDQIARIEGAQDKIASSRYHLKVETLEEAKLTKSIASATDANQKKSLKAKRTKVARDAKANKRLIKAKTREANNYEKKWKKINDEAKAIKREMKVNKCR